MRRRVLATRHEVSALGLGCMGMSFATVAREPRRTALDRHIDRALELGSHLRHRDASGTTTMNA